MGRVEDSYQQPFDWQNLPDRVLPNAPTQLQGNIADYSQGLQTGVDPLSNNIQTGFSTGPINSGAGSFNGFLSRGVAPNRLQMGLSNRGLQDIPKEYYEAAEIDGATPVQSFWNITFPLLQPTSFFVLLVSIVAAVAGSQAFDLIYVMTKGGPANSTQVIIVYIYQQAFQYSAFGYAAAMASILVVILLGLTGILFLLTRGGRFQHD
jgi:hypothetical protein